MKKRLFDSNKLKAALIIIFVLAIPALAAAAGAYPVTRVELWADKTSPATFSGIGNVTFTAEAQDGAAPQEYEYRLRDTGMNWSVARPYSTTSTWVWTPSVAGSYIIKVCARETGSANACEASKTMWFHLGEMAPVSEVRLSADKDTPNTVSGAGTVTFTAISSGGVTPQYEFWLRDTAGNWTNMQSYSGLNTWSWAPAVQGSYVIKVYAKSIGNSTLFDSCADMWFHAGDYQPVTMPKLQANKPSPNILPGLGTVTFQATADNGNTPQQFEFWVIQPNGSWTLEQAYSATSTFNWTPGATGSYIIRVNMRGGGNTTAFESAASMWFNIGDTTPVANLDFYADKTSPKSIPAAGSITFTANALDGNTPQYEFWMKTSNGSFYRVQPYSGDNTWTWTPGTEGNYLIYVYARSSGNNTVFDSSKYMWFVLGANQPVTKVELSANKKSPAWLSTLGTVTFTAAAYDGNAPQEYEFWLMNSNLKWTKMQSFQTQNWWNWIPGSHGSYIVRVNARGAGNSNYGEASAIMWFHVGLNEPVAKLDFYANKSLPNTLAGAGDITFIANAFDGNSPQEYRFSIQNSSGNWDSLTGYNTQNWQLWIPPSAGSYLVTVDARGSGNTTFLDSTKAIWVNLGENPPVTYMELYTDKPSPTMLLGLGTVSVIANAMDGNAPQEYEFWLMSPNGVWNAVRTYGIIDTWSWTPSSAGSYMIKAYAKGAGNSTKFESVKSMWYHIGTNQPVTSLSLSANKPSPNFMGNVGTVIFNSVAYDGMGPQMYEYWLVYPDGTWELVRNYDTQSSWNWTPPSQGSYVVRVNAKGNGNPTLFESTKTMWFHVGDVPPVTSVSLGANYTSPQPMAVGTITLTATANDGVGPQEYEFWAMSPYGIWNPLCVYSTANNCAWTHAQGAGAYLIRVYARSSGNTTTFEAGKAMWFTINP